MIAPLASVLVACRSDIRTYRLLHALSRQTAPPGSFEVVVVENGSGLISPEESPMPIVYDRLPQANMAAARNRGLQLARGKYVLLTDADCVPAAEWVEQCIAALAGGAAGIGGAIERHCPLTPVQKYGSNIVGGQNQLNFLPVLPLPYVVGANSAFRRELLLKIGGFDESLKSGNDVDICYQIGLRGFRLMLVPTAIVYHDNRRGVAAHFLRFYRYALYHVALFRKYRAESGRRVIINPYPWELFGRAARAFPQAMGRLCHGDLGPLWIAFLEFVEGLGVLCGNLHGAVIYRSAYL